MLALFSLIFTISQAAPPDWTTAALRLSGENERIHSESLRQLRAIPDLEALLRGALRGEQRLLALDVISAMKIRSLLPDLLTLSAADGDGSTYLAIDSLVDAENQAPVAQLYLRRLRQPGTRPAAQIVLLDTLLRMRVRLDPGELGVYLFESASPEVRSAALYYLRDRLVHLHDPDYLPSLRRATGLRSSSELWKTQLQCLTAELPRGFR